MMKEERVVNMGRYEVSDTGMVLVSVSLGSCVGVALYDNKKRIGGLAHIMLPNTWRSVVLKENYNTDKFADVAIPAMVENMKKKGSDISDITAKVVGGAHMFPGLRETEIMDIGKKNLEAVNGELKKFGINITASETGGHIGRTVKFDTETGELTVKTKDVIHKI